jgi:uncharacterized membrane protein
MPFAAAPAPPAAPGLPSVPPAASRLSVGSVVGRSFSVWFANFVPFSIVTLAFYVPSLVLVTLAPEEGGRGWELLDRLLWAISQLLVTGALTSGVLVSLGGGRASAGALLGSGFRNMGAVFATGFRVGLWLLLGAVLLVVPAIVWYCALFVAVPAVVVETNLESSADALQRSRDLTQGSRWAVFAVVLVVTVATVLVTVAAALAAVFVEGVPHPIPVLLATAAIALASTLSACAAAVAYHDLRTSREGVATADLAKVFE